MKEELTAAEMLDRILELFGRILRTDEDTIVQATVVEIVRDFGDHPAVRAPVNQPERSPRWEHRPRRSTCDGNREQTTGRREAVKIDGENTFRYPEFRNSRSVTDVNRIQVRGGALRRYEYTVFFEPQEGGYNVIVPAIPEICTFGETLEEARAMAEDAIRCYLESALKTGEPIPEDTEPTKERLAVSV